MSASRLAKDLRAFRIGLTLLALGAICPVHAVEDRAIGVAAQDREMNAAIATARAKLPHFWKVMAAPRHGESDFCLKVRITESEEVEHFWCIDVKLYQGKITAVIGNEPEVVRSVRLNERIVVKEEDISDWLYMRDGKMIGNYTVRPLMKSMSSEERAYLVGILGELPPE